MTGARERLKLYAGCSAAIAEAGVLALTAWMVMACLPSFGARPGFWACAGVLAALLTVIRLARPGESRS